MAEQREARELGLYDLSDLVVDTLGLVRRGANRKPFYVVKSMQDRDLGGTSMSEAHEDFAAILSELEAVEEVNGDAWDKALGAFKSLVERYSELVAQAEPEPEPDEPDEFAERIQAVEEKFAEQLKAEQEKREIVEQVLAQETRKRRLAEFSDVARGYGSISTGETFAEDLMTLADYDEALYGRLSAVLKAADEALGKADLFAQYSSAQTVTGDPFEAKVEMTRVERFSDLKYAEGYTKAFEVVMTEHPDMAREYAHKGR